MQRGQVRIRLVCGHDADVFAINPLPVAAWCYHCGTSVSAVLDEKTGLPVIVT